MLLRETTPKSYSYYYKTMTVALSAGGSVTPRLFEGCPKSYSISGELGMT